MCGICGIVRYDNRSVEHSVKSMTKGISHRGPDGDGYYFAKNVGLGHRRLAIIDPAGGKQPIYNEDQSLVIVFNGEIYNYIELRNELIKLGHKFSTESDTEVVLHSFEQWQEKCLLRMRGMFAFAIVNTLNKQLFLARDCFGIKPLYYRFEKNYFAFCSEIKPLLKVGGKVSGNISALKLFFKFQYIPNYTCIYNEIKKMDPGSYMYISLNNKTNKKMVVKKFWEPDFLNTSNNYINEKLWISKTQDCILDSVRKHIVSDVPFGVFLSGGIDSTLVALMMKRVLKRKIEAFSIGFSDNDYSELKYAKIAAKKIGINLNYEIIDDIDENIVEELLQHYCEPFGDSSMIPTWYVSRLASQKVSMVLSGDGGDENFGGYESYIGYLNENNYVNNIKTSIKNLDFLKFRSVAGAVYNKIFKNKLETWETYVECFTKSKIDKLFNKNFNIKLDKFDEVNKKKKIGYNTDLQFAQHYDYKNYLVSDILTKVDIASMCHGLEVRTPLIDKEIFKLVSKMPDCMKIKFINNNLTGKYVLKKILLKDFDKSFVNRKKMGFSIPLDKFIKNKGIKIIKSVYENNNNFRKIFNNKYLYKTLECDLSNIKNLRNVWLLYVSAIWFRNNKEIEF